MGLEQYGIKYCRYILGGGLSWKMHSFRIRMLCHQVLKYGQHVNG